MRPTLVPLILCLFACGPDESLLSGTGLYEDIGSKTVSSDALEYAPSFALWSDGASKRRWMILPEGAAIDTSDMDRWRFPIGTKLFKEFSRDGMLIETRLVERTGPGPEDYTMVAYLWREDGSDAEILPEGMNDVLGTTHDVPRQEDCMDCHGGEPGRVLGLSAMQLPVDGDLLTLSRLAETGRLTDEPSAGGYPPPGTSTLAPVLGYLHANCGTCHNEEGAAYEDTRLNLRLAVTESAPEETAIYRTTIGVGIESWRTSAYSTNVVPGAPDESALLARMRLTDDERMPPIASEIVDDSGVVLIRDWIAGLPPQ